MNEINAIDTQQFLVVLLEDELPISFLLSINDKNSWQFAVEIIYRLVVCNIVEFYPDILLKDPKYPNETYHGIHDFCCHLSRSDPSGDFNIWFNAQINLTDYGKKLVGSYFHNFDKWHTAINKKFIERLEGIFNENNVNWDENNPKFPIRT